MLLVMNSLRITSFTAVNALGSGTNAIRQRLQSGESGLRPCDFDGADIRTWIGRVDGLEIAPVGGSLAAYDCRNNRLAQLGLQQDGFESAVARARARYGAGRLGVFLGTSTSGMLETEQAYRIHGGAALGENYSYLHTQDIFSVAGFTRAYLGLEGPAVGLSTACSSSAKAFASAHRYINAGLCDAAVVGGVDSLCLTTLYGFHSLELTADAPCRPWDMERSGLNIGEAAGFALLEPAPQEGDQGLALLGYGESSDAYHMSSAHPEGAGAEIAMQEALTRAGIRPESVDYINLHGTATISNDAAEDLAVVRVFDTRTPCSSTKGFTGHTLGAAGITEAVIACLCIAYGFMPANHNLRQQDPALKANILTEYRLQTVNRVLSNSFGFGGSNCSLLFGRFA